MRDMDGSLVCALACVLAWHSVEVRAQAAAGARPPRPNIVLILADDLGWGDVGFNGRREWQTPNLDRLAAQGTVFRRWYTGAVVCAPSRAVLMTGKYTIHNGVSGNSADLPRAETTIAEALRPLGYRTALFGKWHHGRTRPGESSYVHPLDHGFDEFAGYTDARDAWEHFPKELWFGRERRAVQGYAPTILTGQTIDFIRRNRAQPFFVYLAYIEPHLRIEAPAGDVAEQRGKFKEKDASKPLNATYAAMITRIDKEIGRLMGALDELDLARNTLVVFSSDHGATFEPLNEGTAAYHDSNRPFRGQKRTLWEGGIRVPSLVRWPGEVPAGKTSSEVVCMMDVFPTLVAAAGGSPDPAWRVDGANLLDVWKSRTRAPERTILWEWRSEGYFQLAALRGNLKYVITGEELFRKLEPVTPAGQATVGNPGEMYDVEDDPAERRSVIFEHLPLALRLRRELVEWLKTETRDSIEGREPARAETGR